MLMLVRRAPEIVAGIASGGTSGGLSRGDMTQTAQDLGQKAMTPINAAGATAGAIRTANTMEGGWTARARLNADGKGNYSTSQKAWGTAANLYRLGTAGIGDHVPGIGAYRATQDKLRRDYNENEARKAQNKASLTVRESIDKEGNTKYSTGWNDKNASNYGLNNEQMKRLDEISKKLDEMYKKKNNDNS